MKRYVLLALLVVSAVGPAAVLASSPPKPLCSVCEDGFERAAADAGLEATVTHSTVEVVVRENGSARWTVRNRLANASSADRLRADQGLCDRVVRTALGDSHRKPDPARISDVSARVEGNVTVVTFAHPSFAESTVGDVLVVDYFHSGGDRRSYGLTADEFTVVGPEGTVVVNDPAMGEVHEGQDRDGRVTWETVDDEHSRVDRYVADTYVAFGPSDGVVRSGVVSVAFAVRTVPMVLSNLALLVPAALMFAVGLAGLGQMSRVGRVPVRPGRVAAVVLAAGLLAVVHPAYAGTVPFVNDDITALSAVGAAYVLVGATALALVVGKERVPWWWLLVPAVATPPVAALLVTFLSYPSTPWDVSDTIWLGVPLASTFPLGYAVGRGKSRARRRALATTLAVTAAMPLQFLTFTEQPVVGGLVSILAAFLVVFGLLFAVPLYLLGESLARNIDASAP